MGLLLVMFWTGEGSRSNMLVLLFPVVMCYVLCVNPEMEREKGELHRWPALNKGCSKEQILMSLAKARKPFSENIPRADALDRIPGED